MRLRCPTSVVMLGALLAIGFGTQPMVAHAASMNPNAAPATATYRLTSSTSLAVPDANIQGPQVVALILPAGSVVPPKLADGTEGSPLTILPDSHGFDPSHLVVALKDGTSASGQPEQMFGLVFFGQGFQPGGVLHFALSIDKSLANNPPTLQALTSGISIVPDPPAATTTTSTSQSSGGSTAQSSGGSTSGSGSNVSTPLVGQSIPEPLSVVLWSAMVLGVVGRNRLRRRPKQI